MNDILASAMSCLALLFDGGMGWAILALALSVRLALLPLTLHLSRRMLIVWKLSAGVGLYWAASAFVGAVQSFILRHEQRRMAAGEAGTAA
ncbi:MAG: hypothetical protein V7631_2039 [Massilia sp.]|jgi:membrane protein insertase Oxa1/YidC/SpoIIIJ